MIVTTHATHTTHENSITVVRSDSSRIDFCHIDNELVVAHTGIDGDVIGEVTLTMQEAEQLFEHMKSILIMGG